MFTKAFTKLTLVAVLGILFLSPAPAQAENCSTWARGYVCLENPSPLFPAELLKFRVPATTTLVAGSWQQTGSNADGELLDPRLITQGPPGGSSIWGAVITADSTYSHESRFFVQDGELEITIGYRGGQHNNGGGRIYAQGIAPAIKPVLKLGPRQSRFTFTARRSVKAKLVLTLAGRGRHAKTIARQAKVIHGGFGTNSVAKQFNPKQKCRAAGYQHCVLKADGSIYTRADGKWWISKDASARKRIRG